MYCICLGLNPLVAWKLADETVYCMEACANDTATLIEWAQNMQLFDDVTETATIAQSVTGN